MTCVYSEKSTPTPFDPKLTDLNSGSMAIRDAFDYELFSTRVVCIPRGYPEEAERYGLDPKLVIELT